MGAAAWYAGELLTTALPGRGEIVKAVRVFSSIGIGVLVLLAAARLLRIAEFDDAVSRVTRRILPSKSAAP